MNKLAGGCNALAFIASLSLIVGAVGCGSGVDPTHQHSTVDGGAPVADSGAPAPSPSAGCTEQTYICPADEPEDPADCDQHFFEDATQTAINNGSSTCGQQLNDTCTALISPISPNTHCDGAELDYMKEFDEVINGQCEVNDAEKEAAKAHMECTDETNECNDAYKEEGEAENECDANYAQQKADCHCPKAAEKCEEAAYKDEEVKQKQAELACDFDKVANAQCEYAGCMIEPECNCAIGLTKGSGGAGSGCSAGNQCSSGLCTVNPSSPTTASGTENGTCAAPPPSYCCLSFANGACSEMNDPESGAPIEPDQCPPSPSDGGGDTGGTTGGTY